MYRLPDRLDKGATIRIVAPAKAIEEKYVVFARETLEKNGFNVQVADHCLGQYHYFSGSVSERLTDFQQALNDPSVDAILCARGGYGSVQLVDKLDWSMFMEKPKWIIGFSDITVFHQRLATMQIGSMHATMPLNFKENSPEAIDTLLFSLMNSKQATVSIPGSVKNRSGETEGVLLGGNASIVYSMLGTNDHPDYKGSILFLEDLAEQLYHIDRIFHALEKSGVLKQINGLIIGGMTDLKDTLVPFGQTLEEIILGHVAHYQIPVLFNFPAGHIDDNRALVFGDQVKLTVTPEKCTLQSSL